ncbi:MAG: type II toxin-antitoxin system RelE/ParE family toxin [Velocimicrobium sp.]
MSSNKVVITKTAQQDLLDIFDYIAFELREGQAARNLLAKIRKKIMMLEEFPERNALIGEPNYRVKNIRWCPIENYVIFYQISEFDKNVIVLRVLYKRRNWEYLLSSDEPENP